LASKSGSKLLLTSMKILKIKYYHWSVIYYF